MRAIVLRVPARFLGRSALVESLGGSADLRLLLAAVLLSELVPSEATCFELRVFSLRLHEVVTGAEALVSTTLPSPIDVSLWLPTLKLNCLVAT